MYLLNEEAAPEPRTCRDHARRGRPGESARAAQAFAV